MHTQPPRAPRYGRFIGTGVALGALAALVLVLVQPVNPTYSRTQAVLYVGMLLGAVGGLGGGGIAVLLDRRTRPR